MLERLPNADIAAAGFARRAHEWHLPRQPKRALTQVYAPLAIWLAKRSHSTPAPLLVGLNGAQGVGKTNFARLLCGVLRDAYGLRPAILSLDDFYHTQAHRAELASRIHTLCCTRGVPGTHDIALALRTLDSLRCASGETRTPLPSFDKATDDRSPRQEWRVVHGGVDLVMLEGWCVGASASLEPERGSPINSMEREHDPEEVWWRWSERALREEYPQLFQSIDLLITLQVPSMADVVDNRWRQERALALQRTAMGASCDGLMDRAQVERFVALFERLTRRMGREMRACADALIDWHPGFHYTVNRIGKTTLKGQK